MTWTGADRSDGPADVVAPADRTRTGALVSKLAARGLTKEQMGVLEAGRARTSGGIHDLDADPVGYILAAADDEALRACGAGIHDVYKRWVEESTSGSYQLGAAAGPARAPLGVHPLALDEPRHGALDGSGDDRRRVASTLTQAGMGG